MDGPPTSIRSRSAAAASSQTPSPSHFTSITTSSTATASAAYLNPTTPTTTANNNKRNFHSTNFSLTKDDDYEDPDSTDAGEEEDDEDADPTEDDDSDPMRAFTAARLDSSSSAAALKPPKPPKPEPSSSSPMKVDSGTNVPSDGGAGSNAAAAEVKVELATNASGRNLSSSAGFIPGIVVKEDAAKGILFTENIQTSGSYSAREEGLKREEDAGRLKFVCCSNDGVDEHIIWLIGLKNIFARQLPNMPKEYIVRLVMDRTHKSMMVIRNNQVVGGITYRPYKSQKFGEIAFCAITADEQVKGYGTRLMNHLKQHARDVDGLTHFLTYADNNAVGYFIKQGFTKDIHLDKERWHGYIKDYDGGLLMECKIEPKLPYTDLATMIRRQRKAIDEKIRELSNCHIVYPGIDFQKKDSGIPRKLIKVEDIPGLREAGWAPDQCGHLQFFKTANGVDSAAYRQPLNNLMRQLLKSMSEHPDAWPFKEPVHARDAPDYYDIIKDPIDLKTMSKRLESEQYYVTFEMFVADMRRMFSNARTYNTPETIYYKCANRLENHFSSKVQAHLQSSIK